jgi:4-hydroxy-tetrahydrodipicolinate synthase
MATPPPYIVPTEEEIVAFYDTISDSVAVPLMVYNWPPGTNVDMSPATIRRLARIEHVVAVKDSTSDKAKLAETTAAVAGEIRVFGDFINDFGITVMRQHGGDGYIGGGALLGSLLPEFFAAVESGDVARAHEIAQINVKLNAQLVNEDWTGCYGPLQSQVKAAMNLMGQPGGFTRPPRLPITDHGKLSSLSAALESVGLTISPKTLSPMLADG